MATVSLLTEEDVIESKSRKYPNPFFDLATTFIPKNIKTLFKFCKFYFYTNGFLHNVITKLTEYPITDILLDNDLDDETYQKYTELLNDKLKIKSFLIEIGLDYFTYGNAFVTFNQKHKRFLTCPTCKESTLIEHVTKLKLFKYQFKGNCPNPKCSAKDVIFKVEDKYIKHKDSFNLVKWSPENIDIEYDALTGDHSYYYQIPSKIKQQLISGNKTLIKNIPLVFLESLKTKKKIVIDKNNFYHFKRPTLGEEDMGWGKPIILPAIKEIYYLQTLKRGNEAIVNEHIVPKKSIFPANTTSLDPFTMLNLGKWKTQIEDQIKKWKVDPNHIGVFPIPIGYQELGGNARTLLLTPEMKFIEESIINSLGVPLEFIKGGTS